MVNFSYTFGFGGIITAKKTQNVAQIFGVQCDSQHLLSVIDLWRASAVYPVLRTAVLAVVQARKQNQPCCSDRVSFASTDFSRSTGANLPLLLQLGTFQQSNTQHASRVVRTAVRRGRAVATLLCM